MNSLFRIAILDKSFGVPRLLPAQQRLKELAEEQIMGDQDDIGGVERWTP